MYYRDRIVGFNGSWGSGLGTLVLEQTFIPCDNGATVRVLDQLFPGFISSGHTVNEDAIEGQDVVYVYDDMGMVLGGLIPYEEWLDQGLPEIPEGGEIENIEYADAG